MLRDVSISMSGRTAYTINSSSKCRARRICAGSHKRIVQLSLTLMKTTNLLSYYGILWAIYPKDPMPCHSPSCSPRWCQVPSFYTCGATSFTFSELSSLIPSLRNSRNFTKYLSISYNPHGCKSNKRLQFRLPITKVAAVTMAPLKSWWLSTRISSLGGIQSKWLELLTSLDVKLIL